jgi:SAM-dependent methyltransferase
MVGGPYHRCVPSDELHLDRARAESFGTVAEQYDRYRPGCPDALIDDLAALRPTQVLDVGCGTGKVAVALASRGLSVLGVEPDERMARVARAHGIPVEVGTFETWDDAGRQFDLITCGDAWHWIAPDLGIPKAARVLRRGGTIARFWNYLVFDEPVFSAFEAVYRTHAPEAYVNGRAPRGGGADPFAENDAFSTVETRTYRWELTLSAGKWVGLASTFSDHQRLGNDRLTALQQALYSAIETFGGSIQSHCGTYVALARRG